MFLCFLGRQLCCEGKVYLKTRSQVEKIADRESEWQELFEVSPYQWAREPQRLRSFHHNSWDAGHRQSPGIFVTTIHRQGPHYFEETKASGHSEDNHTDSHRGLLLSHDALRLWESLDLSVSSPVIVTAPYHNTSVRSTSPGGRPVRAAMTSNSKLRTADSKIMVLGTSGVGKSGTYLHCLSSLSNLIFFSLNLVWATSSWYFSFSCSWGCLRPYLSYWWLLRWLVTFRGFLSSIPVFQNSIKMSISNESNIT